jgi:hypothetical protein
LLGSVAVGIVDALGAIKTAIRCVSFQTSNTIAIGGIAVRTIRVAVLAGHVASRAVGVRGASRASISIDLEASIAAGARAVGSIADIAARGAVLTGC